MELEKFNLRYLIEKISEKVRTKQDKLKPDYSLKLDGADISVSLPTKVVTNAEYLALSEEEKEKDILYVVKDKPAVLPNGEVTNNVYSTEETVVGMWIDGRPLYRKVIEFVYPTNAGVSTITTFDNTTIVPIKVYGGVFENSIDLYPIPYASTNAGGWALGVRIYDGIIATDCGSSAINEIKGCSGYIVFEYIKTIDEAVS